MNRIKDAIAKMKQQIADRIESGETTQAKVDESNKKLDMGWDEYTAFQTHKSAVTGSVLTLEEAMTVYGYLGEAGPEKFNKQPIEVKYVLTQVFQELLAARLSSK